MKRKPVKVFLSHARADAGAAAQIAKALKAQGIQVTGLGENWKPGADWSDRLRIEMKESDTVAFVVSTSFVESDWAHFEVGAAVSLKSESPDSRLIPIMIEKVSLGRLPAPLRNIKAINGQGLKASAIASGIVDSFNKASE